MALLAGCIWQSAGGSANKICTRQIFAMDTVMSFTAYGKHCEEAVDAAIEEVKRLDALLSAGSPESEISRLNETGRTTVSEDTAVLFERALAFYEDTGGLFDVTVYPLMELWGFPAGEYHVPSEEELAGILPLVGGSRIKLSGAEAELGEGQRADLGGIAKGYTSARIMEIYREYGVRSGMVSLGGNVQVLDRKPDGGGWRIGIRDPAESESMAAVLTVENRAVVTSGGYERYFEEDGNTYIHILDPRTGYPADGGLASVTVVSADGTLADALSTALYIMGLEEALDYWKESGGKNGEKSGGKSREESREESEEESGEEFELVLITETGEMYVTEGLKSCVETEDGFTVVER